MHSYFCFSLFLDQLEHEKIEKS